MAGITTALIVGSLVSAGTTAYAAKKQSDAAKKAAETQVAGAKDAQGYIDKAYEESKATLAPWTNAGQVALGSLMSTGGYGSAMGSSSPPASTSATPNWGSTEAVQGYTNANPRPAINPDTGAADLMAWRQGRAEAMREARLGDTMAAAEQRSQSSYVKMQAPDGTVEDVPSQHVQHYSQLGATVVG